MASALPEGRHSIWPSLGAAAPLGFVSPGTAESLFANPIALRRSDAAMIAEGNKLKLESRPAMNSIGALIAPVLETAFGSIKKAGRWFEIFSASAPQKMTPF
jgi:hypothetical protein